MHLKLRGTQLGNWHDDAVRDSATFGYRDGTQRRSVAQRNATLHRPPAARRGGGTGVADHSDERCEESDTTRKSKKCRVSCVFPAQEEKRAKGLEPSTSSLGSRDGVVLSPVAPALTTRRRKRCTNGCTSSRGAPASGSPAADGAEAGQPSLRNGLDQLPVVVEELALRLAALPPEVLAVLQTLFTDLPKRP